MRNVFAVGALFAATLLALSSRPAQAQNKLQIEDASTAAIAAVGGAQAVWFAKGDQRVENGVEVWRFTFTKDNATIFQVRVDAFTGAAIKVDRVGPANGDGPAITMNRAAQIGRGAQPGYVWKVEPQLFNGATHWSVKILGADGKQFEVIVDQNTGMVLRTERRQNRGGRNGSGNNNGGN